MYIIAEIGSNWESLDDCFQSIQEAHNSGANAAKFQMFTHAELYGISGQLKHELPHDWVPLLRRQCDRSGIEFMCTAFSPEGFEYINPYVDIHKIASSCITTTPILKKVASFNKKTILSTGASSIGEIRLAMNHFPGQLVTPLYCVANYPAKVINLENIRLMEKELGVKVGYSDHSTDVLNIPRMAVQMGAVVIEKHLDCARKGTPDSPHSISPDEFRLMVDSINNIRTIPRIGWIPEEQGMVLMHRNRLMAIKDIKSGDMFDETNYGCFRSKEKDMNGMSGFCYEAVNGKVSRVDIKSGM